MRYKYYRFTKEIDPREIKNIKEDYPMLQGENQSEWKDRVELSLCMKWLEHFDAKGIPACITRHDHGYNVWRIGTENISYGCANDEPLHGEIIKECRSFSRLTGKALA